MRFYFHTRNASRLGCARRRVRPISVIALGVMIAVALPALPAGPIFPDRPAVRALGHATADWVEANYDRLVDEMRRDAFGWTPLMMAAARSTDPRVIDALIERGQVVAARSIDGWTALMFAAAFGTEPYVIRALIDAGAATGERTSDAWAALFGAARYTSENLRFDALQATQEATDRGWTPLFFAARFNPDPAIAAALIDAGADSAALDEHGRTAAYYAERHNRSAAVAATIRSRAPASARSR